MLGTADSAPGPGPQPAIRLNLRATEASVREALAELARELARSGLPRQDVQTAELVIAEICNNIVEHAYRGQAPGRIDLAVARAPRALSVAVRDTGRPMPALPAAGSAPCLDGPRDRLPEGGFGWFLIRQLSRGIAHDRVGGVNITSLEIPLSAAGAPQSCLIPSKRKPE